MAISFIHTGDVHIGMEFTKNRFGEKYGRNKRLDIIDTFIEVINICKNKKIDLLLIAGDLFEDSLCSISELKVINEKISELKNTKVIIVTGNHDYMNDKSLYKLLNWSSNVYILDNKNIQKITFDDIGVNIYGLSWYEKEKNFMSFHDLNINKNQSNILLLHGDILNKDSQYMPISKKELETKGFDYVALGHIHKHQFISENICYCGSPEPLDFGETGKHGIVLGEINNKEIHTKFLPISKREYIVKNITINPNINYNDIISKIFDICNNEDRRNNYFKIIVKGMKDRDSEFNFYDIENRLENEFHYIEIIDETKPDYDIEKIMSNNKDNLIGIFIQTMIDKGLENHWVKNSLYIGLEELLNEKVNLK